MKTVALFYFSGTGNTKIVAGMFKDAFTRQGYCVDMMRMEDIIKKQNGLESGPV